jgi:maltose O-acetyltransferase
MIPEPEPEQTGLVKLWRVLLEEVGPFHVRLWLARCLALPLPPLTAGRVRALLLRCAGLRVGRGAMLAGMPAILAGPGLERLLTIGPGCWFNVGCTLDVHAELTIGAGVRLGQEVMILTESHDIGTSEMRAGHLDARAVTIGDGAWIGARATILPGTTIGAGSVVAAGALVREDVPPDTLVAGVPARVIRSLDGRREDLRPRRIS